MSRTLISLLLTFVVLLVWFYILGQTLQGIEVAFALGLIIGIVVGLWIGGGLILRKLRKEEHERVDSTYAQRSERHL